MKIEKAEPHEGLERITLWVTRETRPRLQALKTATGKSFGRIVSELVAQAEVEANEERIEE